MSPCLLSIQRRNTKYLWSVCVYLFSKMIQTVLCPVVYVGWVGLLMYTIDITVASLTYIEAITVLAHHLHQTHRSLSLRMSSFVTCPHHGGVIFFFRLQVILALVCVSGTEQSATSLFGHNCRPFGWSPLFMFLNGLILFTPWMPVIYKLWGATLNWAYVHINSLTQVDNAIQSRKHYASRRIVSV